MAKFKKRSVAPIYAIALVWVIFTLVHPLYRVSDYVSVILLSALAFVVAKGIWPTVEYELTEPEQAEDLPEEEPAQASGEDPSQPDEQVSEDIPEEGLAEDGTEETPSGQEEPTEDAPDKETPSPDPEP